MELTEGHAELHVVGTAGRTCLGHEHLPNLWAGGETPLSSLRKGGGLPDSRWAPKAGDVVGWGSAAGCPPLRDRHPRRAQGSRPAAARPRPGEAAGPSSALPSLSHTIHRVTTTHRITTTHRVTDASARQVRGVRAIICHTREAAKLQPNRESSPESDAPVPPGSRAKPPTGSGKPIPPVPSCASQGRTRRPPDRSSASEGHPKARLPAFPAPEGRQNHPGDNPLRERWEHSTQELHTPHSHTSGARQQEFIVSRG